MKWIKESHCFPKYINFTSQISKLGTSWYHTVDRYFENQPRTGCLSPTPVNYSGSVIGSIGLRERWNFENYVFKGFGQFDIRSLRSMERVPLTIFRQFGQSARKEPCLSRDWLVQLWLVERNVKNSRRKKTKRVIQNVQSMHSVFENLSSFQLPSRRWFVDSSVAEERPNNQGKLHLEQPPLSQSATDFLEPASPEEVKVAPLLARANLLITRDIEWANLMLGFEQENRYAIVDACYPQSPVGFIREQSNVVFRQLLRTRRPFIAHINDAMGNELFRVRRPFWLINSTIYAEIDGKEVGVVHRRWHLWRRVYDLYLGKTQFAVVENAGFWNWTFTLKDIDGNVLAEIDRDWRGIGFELLTDAGQYVIRFGQADLSSKTDAYRTIQELEVSRPLTLSERAIAVALAVSLDNDYFSRHGGWGIPFVAVGE